jgi:hypothetical protein
MKISEYFGDGKLFRIFIYNYFLTQLMVSVHFKLILHLLS